MEDKIQVASAHLDTHVKLYIFCVILKVLYLQAYFLLRKS